MIAVDTNILIYAHREDSPFYTIASSRIAELAEGTAAWAIPWPCLHEFLSIVSNPRIFAPPTPMSSALNQVAGWLQSPTLVLLAETHVHWEALRKLIENGGVYGPRVHDARVAALCLQNGVRELWSADRDFKRFSNLRVVNPLMSEQS